jgi:hypothetical protein
MLHCTSSHELSGTLFFTMVRKIAMPKKAFSMEF